MIHAREDYNRMQDPALHDRNLLSEGSTAIAEDEPVFLLRAQDKHFLAMLLVYREKVADDPTMVAALNWLYDLAAVWQSEHGSKTPDM